MEKKPVVHLRVYRGSDLNYTANGKIKNENQSIKITHNTVHWADFKKHLHANQYVKVEVEKVLDGNDHTKELSDISKFIEEVEIAFNGPKIEKALTPEQIEIAELKAQLNAFMSAGKKESIKNDSKEEIDIELQAARDEYVKVFSKKGHHSWTVEQIKEKIEAETAKAE